MRNLFLSFVLVIPVLGFAKQPNILFAISDDQSWVHAGAYGDKHILTPAFDRVAREGVLVHPRLLRRALLRAFTGRYSHWAAHLATGRRWHPVWYPEGEVSSIHP